MIGPRTRERRLSYSDPAFKLGESDKQFVPQFLQRRNSITLKPQFNNELIAESIDSKHYLSEQQREQYRITCHNGIYKDTSGKAMDGAFVYVLFPDDRLYAVSIHARIHHSHLSSGLSLKGAGIHYYQKGRLITVSNESGHYKPTLNEMRDALLWFYQQNLNQPFVFEDHSAQDKLRQFNGIRFFEVKKQPEVDKVGLEPIAEAQLVQTLERIKREALSIFDTKDEETEFEKALARLYLAQEQSGDNSVYYTQASAHQPTQVEEPVINLCDIFKRRDLLSLTCLQFAKDEGRIASRFNGVLRFSK
ncbi:MAG: hypothetical protein JSR17_06505 [Proteobacteria bacterium]|nr:hypothetical protein [Pseudomonadota bacterium]